MVSGPGGGMAKAEGGVAGVSRVVSFGGRSVLAGAAPRETDSGGRTTAGVGNGFEARLAAVTGSASRAIGEAEGLLCVPPTAAGFCVATCGAATPVVGVSTGTDVLPSGEFLWRISTAAAPTAKTAPTASVAGSQLRRDAATGREPLGNVLGLGLSTGGSGATGALGTAVGASGGRAVCGIGVDGPVRSLGAGGTPGF
jgi:hypothetical protein